MTEEEARAKLDALGALSRSILMDERVAHLVWEPGNMTRYELLLVPWEVAMETEWDREWPTMGHNGSPGLVYVCRYGGGTGHVYPLRMWELDGTSSVPDHYYCAEKWASSNIADGAAIHLLLSAIAGAEPRCTFEDARCMFEVAS